MSCPIKSSKCELDKSATDTFYYHVCPVSRDTNLIDYQNAQIILIGAREGPDIIKNEIGVDINYYKNETQESSSADILTKLKVRKEQVPIRPLLEGKLE
jgi:hypothetical protein